MQFANPYDLFSPIHIDWLYRRHEKKLDVTTADLDSIEASCPARSMTRCSPTSAGAPTLGPCVAVRVASLYRRRAGCGSGPRASRSKKKKRPSGRPAAPALRLAAAAICRPAFKPPRSFRVSFASTLRLNRFTTGFRGMASYDFCERF